MKRSRDEIERHLVVLTNKRAAVEKLMRRVDENIEAEKKDLAALDAADADCRNTTVPWDAFYRAATCSSIAWKSEDFGDDAYHAADQCDLVGDDCWYQRNLDRVDELQLFTLKTTCGLEFTLCDMCYRNDGRGKVVYDSAHGETVKVDPVDFEAPIAKFLERAGRDDFSEDELWNTPLKKY